jgi:hypothetical protein
VPRRTEPVRASSRFNGRFKAFSPRDKRSEGPRDSSTPDPMKSERSLGNRGELTLSNRYEVTSQRDKDRVWALRRATY